MRRSSVRANLMIALEHNRERAALSPPVQSGGRLCQPYLIRPRLPTSVGWEAPFADMRSIPA